ncbi:MAG: hypothetical protein IVW57_04670 [Ktedonobacterales bacterium]|nr:hypothetical protein [Ktedonobacterales bacterium]
MNRHLGITKSIALACRHEDALTAVQNIKDIEKTEVKADAVDVHPEDAHHGTYDVRGHFMGIPWRNAFAYQLNEHGFHSLEAHPPVKGNRVSGGFIVGTLADGRRAIYHYEDYVLPRWAIPAKPLLRLYLARSMEKELRDLRQLITAGG